MTVFKRVVRSPFRDVTRAVGRSVPVVPVTDSIVYFDFTQPFDSPNIFLSKGSQAGVQIDISLGPGADPVHTIGKGLIYSGANASISTGATLPIGSAARSLMARYQVTSVAALQAVAAWGSNALANQRWELQSGAAADQTIDINASDVAITSPVAVNNIFLTSAFSYVAAATLPVGTVAYFDGVTAVSTATTGIGVPATVASQLAVASDITGALRFLTGTISHIIVFDRVLTPGEVLAIHNFWGNQ